MEGVPGRDAFLSTLNLDVHVVSDIICPWCFMGKRRLERALEELYASTGVGSTVRWHPWELAPKLPRAGMPKLEMYRRRFRGDDERLAAMLREIKSAGIADGIAFSFDGIVGPTLDAHRLLHMVRDCPDLQGSLAEELFKAYHEHGENPADTAVLLRCAAAAGLGREACEAAQKMLEGVEGESEVRAEMVSAHEKWDMLSGVPHLFVTVQGFPPEVVRERGSQMSFAVPGAQDTLTFLKVFNRALERAQKASQEVPISGCANSPHAKL